MRLDGLKKRWRRIPRLPLSNKIHFHMICSFEGCTHACIASSFLPSQSLRLDEKLAGREATRI